MEAGESRFASEYAGRQAEIRRLARIQRVPGMDPDDVEAELGVCLWRACMTYREDQGTTLGQLWWAIWMNRKADLIDAYFVQKRIHPVPMSPDEVTELVDSLAPLLTMGDLLPPCPAPGTTHHRVWVLLAMGYQAKEVQEILELGRRAYYVIVEGLRSSDARGALT